MDRLIQVLVVLMGGFVATALSLWWADRIMKREARFFRERADAQDKLLAVVNADLLLARTEVSQLRCELTVMRYAVEYIAEGPHSQRAPSRQPS